MKKIVPILALLLVAACGGSSTPTTQGPSPAPQSSRGQATQAAQGGQSIDTAAIQAAVAALKAHDSWQFTGSAYQSGTPNYESTITGTQRTTPQTAISATISRSGQPDKRYTQIGNDVWYDDATGSYVKTTASDNAVISQFQPYYLDGVVQTALTGGYVYESVGADTVSGVSTTHYRLTEATIQDIVKNMSGITTADWGADVWIATADGSLMRITWGPQSADKAQLTTGINLVVTSVDCDCPVNPPA